MLRIDKHFLDIQRIERELNFWSDTFSPDSQWQSCLSSGHITVDGPGIAFGFVGLEHDFNISMGVRPNVPFLRNEPITTGQKREVSSQRSSTKGQSSATIKIIFFQ